MSGSKRWVTLVTLVTITALLLSGCAPSATPTPQVVEKLITKEVVKLVTPTPAPTAPPVPLPDVIHLGTYLAMTGANAALGQQVYEGVSLALKQHPQVLGKTIKLTLVDNRSDKTEAAVAVSRLIEAEKVIGIVGTSGSSLAIPGAEVAEKAGIPVVFTTPTNPLVTSGKKWSFRVCFIDPFQGSVVAKYAFEKLGVKTAAVIQDVAQDYSVGLASFFRDAFTTLTKDKKTIVSFTSYQTGDTDFSAQLTHAISKNPDMIFTTGYYGEAALLIRQARELGYKGIIMGGDALDAPELIKIAGPAADGVLFSTHYHPQGATNPTAKAFVEDYKKEYGKEANAFAALGYDAYLVLTAAIEKAGSVQPEAIRQALEATKNFEGVSGTITLDANHNAIKDAVIKGVKNGAFVYLDTVPAQ